VTPVRPASPAPPVEEDAGWFSRPASAVRPADDGVPEAAPAEPSEAAAPVSASPVVAAPGSPAATAPAPDPAAGAPTEAPTEAPVEAPAGAGEPAADERTAAGEPAEPAEQVEPAEAETPEEPEEPPGPPEPEQRLRAYAWRFDPETLRELVDEPDDLRDVRDRLTEKITVATDNATRARLLSLRSVVSRLLSELGAALADGRLALAHAEATGELRRIAIVQARLAHAHQWRGEFADADRLFTLANSPELPDRLRATLHEHAGLCSLDQGRFMEACDHLDKALALRTVEDRELIARIEVALDTVIRRVREGGWGPYPRTREELLGGRRPPTPAYQERTQTWGYVRATGEPVTPAAYAEARPYADGVAWARRPETSAWELLDATGTVLIDASAKYVAAGPFADGLAWVVREGTRAWVAIDRGNRVVISTGYDDVRTFHAGLAAVRRGGWGAVDAAGRIVVPTRYAGFATALADGRLIEGFTDEGLAVVDAGNGKGVIDRTGRILVPPRHAALAIHPVAFLMALSDGRWGALDRRGELLIDPVHPTPAAVTAEIDRLLADTKPVL
jgi:hypothetical protein